MSKKEEIKAENVQDHHKVSSINENSSLDSNDPAKENVDSVPKEATKIGELSFKKAIEGSDYTKAISKLLESMVFLQNPSTPSEIGKILAAHNLGSISTGQIFNTYLSGIRNEKDKKAILDFEIGKNESQLRLLSTIQDLVAEKKKTKEEISDLKTKVYEYEQKVEIDNIRLRISPDAATLLIRDQAFREKFQHAKNVNCTVLSIDIRRSTELMLKARTPQLYADFIMSLTRGLAAIIIQNFGVFDKFTGDGILAFFPDFYSGEDNLIHAIRAAKQCHECFKAHYSQHKNAFNVFIKDIGLGIGIDYGEVTLVNQLSELTVVGIPVVYACRLSGTDADSTVLNISAFEILNDRYKKFIKYKEKEILIKHEGIALVYEVELLDSAMPTIEDPEWISNLDESD